MENANSKMLAMAAENGGVLPTFAWPGCYPLFYLDDENNVLCPSCANENDDFSSPIVACDANYEDTGLHCDHCGNRIESAYTED